MNNNGYDIDKRINNLRMRVISHYLDIPSVLRDILDIIDDIRKETQPVSKNIAKKRAFEITATDAQIEMVNKFLIEKGING